jgi:hypothetical protein
MAGRSGSGFWRGLATGLVLAAMIALGLAWIFPPVPRTPPELSPGSLEAPPGPGQPDAVTPPEAPHAEGLLPAGPDAPLIDGVPAPDPAPAPASPAGSPSLVPAAKP